MKRMLIVVLLVGCGKSTPPSDSPTEPEEQLPPPQGQSVPECVDAKGEVVECRSDDDCCKGFACAADPEVSIRRRVCLYAF